jgi:hypothetical protein
MDYLNQKLRIVHSTLNPNLFKLESLDLGESPFVATLLPISAQSSERPTLSKWDALTKRRDFSSDEISTDLTIDKCYNAVVSPKCLFNAFRLVLQLPDEAPDVFSSMKQQWFSLSPAQFANNHELPKVIAHIETQVKSRSSFFEKYKEPTKIQKRVFELLLTYTLYNYDKTVYSDGVIDLLLPFVDAYIQQYGETDANLESGVFAVFELFFEKNDFGELKRPQKQPFIRPLLEQVGLALKEFYPELLQLLLQKYVFTLDFLRTDLSRWFVDVFRLEDLKILWLSVLSFQSPTAFFKSFIIALLFMAVAETANLSALTFEEFIEQFTKVKPSCDIRTLLVNVREIHEKIGGK